MSSPRSTVTASFGATTVRACDMLVGGCGLCIVPCGAVLLASNPCYLV